MRLIDADALIKKWENVHSKDISFAMAIIGATNDVKKAPTVEAVPVIRCKDCKHYYALNEVRGNCSEYNFIDKISLDYCSWAERKEDDG